MSRQSQARYQRRHSRRQASVPPGMLPHQQQNIPAVPEPRQRHLNIVRDDAPFANEQALPFGMRAGPSIADEISEVIDLGRFNEKFTGMQCVFNRMIDLSIQDILEQMRDERLPELRRARAAKDFLKKILVAWNFTRRRAVNGQLVKEYLPQPPEGIEALPLSLELLIAILKAFSEEFNPSPN
jgi:hypothetical protein